MSKAHQHNHSSVTELKNVKAAFYAGIVLNFYCIG